ncbi:MAG TPA: hypothetical protein DF383_09935, partial [Deltaproteobacteria bacterium]|nr:hypothetical protein [Deltaproteobacteria bacterium]
EFADNNLKKMAGYRNRLVHFYAEIAPKELYDLLNQNLGDIETFLQAVKAVMRDPKKYGFVSLS